MQVLVDEVKKIALEAGQVIMDIYADEDSFGVEMKSDDSPLTRADRMANDVIVRGLEQLDEQYPIISEENKQLSYSERQHFTKVWMVDPLDGTKEFIKRNGEFTVNIALIDSNRPVMGVVYVPATGDMYWASEGEGAYRESEGVTTPLYANEFSMTDGGLRVVCSRSHLGEATQAYIDELADPQTVSKGSSLKFLIISEGGAELYPRLAPTMEWDTAAADIILTESGGSVVQHGSDQPVQYNKENLLNPHFIAAGAITQ